MEVKKDGKTLAPFSPAAFHPFGSFFKCDRRDWLLEFSFAQYIIIYAIRAQNVSNLLYSHQTKYFEHLSYCFQILVLVFQHLLYFK